MTSIICIGIEQTALERIAQMLASSGTVVSYEELPNYDDNNLPMGDHNILLIYTAPDTLLARAILNQPGKMTVRQMRSHIQVWQTQALRLLALHRQHKDRMLLVRDRSALLAPRALIRKLSEHFKLSLETGQPPDDADKPSPLFLVAETICRAFIRDDSDSWFLYHQLKATAVDLIPADLNFGTESQSVPEIDNFGLQALTRLQQHHEHEITSLQTDFSTVQSVNFRLTADKNLLLAQVIQLETELKRFYEHFRQQKRIERLMNHNKHLEMTRTLVEKLITQN